MEESQVAMGNLNPDVVVDVSDVSFVGQTGLFVQVSHRFLRESDSHGPLEVPFF